MLCEALRPAAVLAKSLATLDRICDGRLDVGIGAGWYEPEYEADRHGDAVAGRTTRAAARGDRGAAAGCSAGDRAPFDGRYHRAFDARNDPPAVQRPTPPIIVGGKGDRLLALVAEQADGWNTCWVWTPDAYRERLDVLERACDAIDRDPATVHALARPVRAVRRGRARPRAALRAGSSATSPPGVLDATTLDEWRRGRLVGTVEQVREQAAGWADLGVETLIVGVGAVPFAVTTVDDVELLAEALRR